MITSPDAARAAGGAHLLPEGQGRRAARGPREPHQLCRVPVDPGIARSGNGNRWK
jgi:hypothetical protein